MTGARAADASGAGEADAGPRGFDVCGPLPRGITVLEASAGTGKTYTIAGLAARYVAEGRGLDRILIVTFTRMATSELRERVRDRLVSVERGLARALAAPGAAEEDPVVQLLAARDCAVHRERLARAIAGFDAATITTTHGFCQEVLAGLGVAGDLEPDAVFVEDLTDLAGEVVDDLYVRRFRHGDPPPFDRRQAIAIARAAIDNPEAEIVASGSDVAQLRGWFAQSARDELQRRKRAMAVMTYDDLVSRLNAALTGDRAGAAAAALRSRFDVVLVDEFQDTDPAQWEIMRSAFGTGGALVLIADPKQAIYAFRGADVYAYLDAAAGATERATLRRNWRSDQALIDAHDALLSGLRLGHEGIVYRRVSAPPQHARPRLTGAPVGAPLRFRVVGRDEPSLSLTPRGFARNASARAHIATDLAADVVALLGSGARVAAAPGATVQTVVVAPVHIAALVRTNRQAGLVARALHDAGVPAVIAGSGSVFATETAREWLRLLEALERPASIVRARSAALTPFVGWSAEQLATAVDDESSPAWERVHRRLHEWARVLRTRGVAPLVEAMLAAAGDGAPDGGPDRAGLAERVLGERGGERRMTDIRHVGELLHAAARADALGPAALTAWLRRRIGEADSDAADDERSRRLESDAEAVQVLTIHRSKGLEFPIVYLPFLWEPGYIPDRPPPPVLFHDPHDGDARKVDVSLEGDAYERNRTQFVREQRGEDLRLAYVALTRARHQATLWWAGSWDSRNSPLGRLLFCAGEHGDVAPWGASTPDDAAVVARLRTLASVAGDGRISIERSSLGLPAAWSPAPEPTVALGVAELTRGVDLRWRRTSYSDITAASHETWVGSEPEEPSPADEPGAVPGAEPSVGPADEPSIVPADEPGAVPDADLPLAALARGVDAGTFVHRVMQETDFAAADLDGELAARIGDAAERRPAGFGPVEALVEGLRSAIETPLGPVLAGLRLRDIARSDRLDELAFELPLAGGERPAGWVTPALIASVLRAHLPRGDPFERYPERLEQDAALRPRVRGFLTGSLDLVVRVRSGGGEPRFAVIDYKTNWLGAALPGEPSRRGDYGPEALRAEMDRRHYALQALLYAVALHRFLRWRQPGYDPEAHLAGVIYLFVRGMTGARAHEPATGVLGWRPPRGLVAALSDALDAGGKSGLDAGGKSGLDAGGKSGLEGERP